MEQKITEKQMKQNLQIRLGELMDGITQSKVEQKTGISRQNLAKYLTGKALPNSFTLYKLADYFEVSCDYLLGVEEGTTHDIEYIIKQTGLSEDAIRTLEDYNVHYDLGYETFAINTLLTHSNTTKFLIALAKYTSAPNIDEADFEDDIYAQILPFITDIHYPTIDTDNTSGEVNYETIKLDDLVYYQLMKEFNNLIDSIKNNPNTKQYWIKHLLDIMKPYYEDELYYLYEHEQETGEQNIKNMNVDVQVLSKVMNRYIAEREKESRGMVEKYLSGINDNLPEDENELI